MLCLSPQKYMPMSEDYLNSWPTHFLLFCAIVRHSILVTALCLSFLFALPSSRQPFIWPAIASVISQSPYFLQVLLPSSHTLLRHRTHTLECLSDAAGWICCVWCPGSVYPRLNGSSFSWIVYFVPEMCECLVISLMLIKLSLSSAANVELHTFPLC